MQARKYPAASFVLIACLEGIRLSSLVRLQSLTFGTLSSPRFERILRSRRQSLSFAACSTRVLANQCWEGIQLLRSDIAT